MGQIIYIRLFTDISIYLGTELTLKAGAEPLCEQKPNFPFKNSHRFLNVSMNILFNLPAI